MPTSKDTIPSLPARCWDLNPESMRKMGAVHDQDIAAHATGEWLQESQSAARLAKELDLSPQVKAVFMRALRKRHCEIWGDFAHPFKDHANE